MPCISPLGQGSQRVMEDPVVQRLAPMKQKSPSQVALKWVLQKGAVFAVQSTAKEHLEQDIDLWSWELSVEDMRILDNEVQHVEHDSLDEQDPKELEL